MQSAPKQSNAGNDRASSPSGWERQAGAGGATSQRGRSVAARRVPASVWGLAAFALLVVSSVLAVRQRPHGNAYRVDEGWRKFLPPPISRWESWAYPVERNAFLRLPYIRGPILGLYGDAGSDRLWVLGSGGSLLCTPDAGATWQDWSVQPKYWEQMVRVGTASSQPPSTEQYD